LLAARIARLRDIFSNHRGNDPVRAILVKIELLV